jgi:hypothetical protein
MKVTIKKIENKIKERNVFLKKYDKSFDSKTLKHKIEEPKEIDVLGKEIKALIKTFIDILPIDFAIESLTMLGDAPNVIYDDNGLFAVTADGFQKVVVGNQKLDGAFTVLVEKKMWKKTIREALKFYLK